jgi:hypothetical protein
MKYFKRYLVGLLFFSQQLCFAQLSSPQKGFADLTLFNFSESMPITLDGEWEFYMSQLISPANFLQQRTVVKDYVDFPSAWNNSSGSQNFGFATYRVHLLLAANQKLALHIPHCYSNYRLWANGTLVSSNGIVDQSPEHSKPQWLPKTVDLPATKDTLELVIQISNFNHAIGGIRESITLGNQREMQLRESVTQTSTLTLVIGLGVLFVIAFFVFVLYKSSSVFHFANMSLLWGIREAFSNHYLAIQYMPDFPWELAVKIEYGSLFLVMIFSILLIGSLFKEDVNNVFKYLFCACNVVFVLLAIFLDASIFTQFLPVYLSFAAALLFYVVYVLIRAVVYERQGVWLIIACVFLGVIIFAYDLISYQGFANFNPIIISFGYLTMFVLLTVALLFHVGIFKRSSATNMLTYDDLYGGGNNSTLR